MRVTKRPAEIIPGKSERRTGHWAIDLIALTLIAATAIILVTVGNAGVAVLAGASGFVVAVYEVWRRNRP
ncbi:hypothetical protein ACFQZZ_26390 [Nocardia sp. GCM10030253]|uniref:hypothetical protein n=1 Tax=Nocardia sp. GCM10030253 TaxID=3273404 RepID=UPI00362700AB